jgi:hypothetical protein
MIQEHEPLLTELLDVIGSSNEITPGSGKAEKFEVDSKSKVSKVEYTVEWTAALERSDSIHLIANVTGHSKLSRVEAWVQKEGKGRALLSFGEGEIRSLAW